MLEKEEKREKEGEKTDKVHSKKKQRETDDIRTCDRRLLRLESSRQDNKLRTEAQRKKRRDKDMKEKGWRPEMSEGNESE